MPDGRSKYAWAKGRRTSVAVILVATIVCIVTLLLAIVGTVAFRYYSEERRQTFSDRLNLAADQLSFALAPPVWNLEYELIDRLVYSRLRDTDLHGIVLELDTRTLAYDRDADGTARNRAAPYPAEGLPFEHRRITSDGEHIGTLTLHGAPERLEAELARTRLYMIGFALMLDIVLILSLYIALRHLVIRPLRKVERYADEISSTEDSNTALGHLRFHGEIDGLKHSIDQMVRKLATRNRELVRTNRRFEQVIQQFPLPIRITDDVGRILILNASFTATFGYETDDVQDLQAWYARAYPDEAYRREVLGAWQRAVANAHRSGGRIEAGTFCVTCRNGEVKTVELAGVQFEELTIGVLQDITERASAETELARYREHLEELVQSRTEELAATYRRLEETQFAMDHAGIAIQWYEAGSGQITYVNDQACRLYGYPREALLGRSITELAPAIDPGVAAPHAKGNGSGGHTRLETTVRRHDGALLPVEFAIYRQETDSDGASGFISFATDISQRKEAEQALITARINAEAAAMARSQFLANMSHEIRTPMNAIIGMTELALQGELDPRQRNFVHKANAAALSLLGIINDILDFSKVESGNLQIEHVVLDLDRVLDELANLVGLKAEEKALELIFDIEPDVPRHIVGDPLSLTQVLINLVGNAIKFTESGHVIVRCRPLQKDQSSVQLRFEVEDTGIGMSREQVSRLFEPFRQGDGSISRRFGGTGLGLAISRRLVEMMGGNIEVQSEPAHGSCFAFTLNAALSDAPKPDARTPALLRNLRVLVVDDHPDALEVLASQLAAMHLDVSCAASAHDALALMQRAEAFDLLITDWRMPGMDGVELVRTLQQRPDLPQPRAIIMVSAYGTEALQHACSGIRVSAILPKPASPSTLLDTIQSALAPRPTGAVPPADARAARPLASLDGLNILLVEDNPVNQELAREVLQRAGARVCTAADGQEALSTLEGEQGFDCVLMDVQMPRMDGLEASRRIRLQARFADLPIIAMTAGALPEEREQTRAAGMNHHLTKPLDVGLMLSTILHWTREAHAGDSAADGRSSPPPRTDAPSAVLNMARGLRATANKHDLYRRLLALHAGGSRQLISRLREAVAANDPDELAALAHRIKGETATLGALEASAQAARLEQRCREEGLEPPENEVERLCEALDRLREHIARLPPAASLPLAESGAGDTFDVLLSKLRKQLESGDTDALETVAALRSHFLAADAEQHFSRLARLVDNYAFDEALAELERATADLEPGPRAQPDIPQEHRP